MYAPETLVLTPTGHLPIASLDGHMVDVWNGTDYSLVLVGKYGEDQKLITVLFDTGAEFTCSTDLRLFIQQGYFDHTIVRKKVENLAIDDRLVKATFPIIQHGNEKFPYAYTHGFYTGAEKYKRRNRIVSRASIYGARRPCLDYLEIDNVLTDKKSLYFYNQMPEDFTLPLDGKYSLETKLEWLAGFFDGGLTKRKVGSQPMWHIYSENFEFLKQVKLLIQTLGEDIRVVKNEDINRLPYSLRFSGRPMQTLRKLAVPTKYITIPEIEYYRRGVSSPRVKQIIDNNRYDTSYTFMEPINHRAVFNGILSATQ